ncbi:hypothetical protein Dpoa2040_003352 [Dickeya sp. CFBP 2040]|uniref:TIGR02642 family protein n=1 Tax=Dickeya sp. CFBP 2040 TaxID=2718531 RepID=UPI001446AA93|nr:TIGR02642 family protein [Dickeya sp. CFBP 2040]NKI76018.1 hypothetical protein [Dickeya sp. CFBP 2040]
MTIAIEQLIKMHDPRCMSIESLNVGRGRSSLSKDQIIGALATAQRHNSVGYDVLMAKYRSDGDAGFRIMRAIYDAPMYAKYDHLEHSDVACSLALSIVLERSLPAQIMHIAKLLRRYGPRSAQWRKRADAINDKVRQLEKRRSRSDVSDTNYHVIGAEIKAAMECMTHERRLFREWSEQQAAQSNVCPRCSGTGQAQRLAIICNECGGSGRITATFEHVRQSLASIGAVMRDEDWLQYLELMKWCLQWLYVEESCATRTLCDKIRDEIGA